MAPLVGIEILSEHGTEVGVTVEGDKSYEHHTMSCDGLMNS